tara:strand:+ start:348 stop:569 length:222 start_codon:yes stop_codon:yes gene_type:complete
MILSQIEEVSSELGEPDCRLTEPFVVKDDNILEPWLLNVTNQNSFMLSSDKILTIVDPNNKLSKKYEELLDKE